jgi:diguanylate cyclase
MDADADDATTIARGLTAALHEPFDLNAVSVRLGASIGIARAPSDATDADGLVACADVAMYRAKLRGEAFALYQPDFDDSGSLLQLAEELRLAVSGGELVLHYRPQLDLKTGEPLFGAREHGARADARDPLSAVLDRGLPRRGASRRLGRALS